MVAAHANLRHQNFFNPFNGGATELSDENVSAATDCQLHVSLPWLDPRYQFYSRHSNSGHPVTGQSRRLCLFDKLHENNTKKKSEILRHLDLIDELKFQINSQAQEQLFSQLKRNNHFLNMMSPGSHLMINRIIINDSNDTKNERVKKDIEKKLRRSTSLSILGKLISENHSNEPPSAIPPPQGIPSKSNSPDFCPPPRYSDSTSSVPFAQTDLPHESIKGTDKPTVLKKLDSLLDKIGTIPKKGHM